MPERTEFISRKLDIFKAKPGTDKLRTELIKLAGAGITHIESSVASLVRGETSIDLMFRNDPSHDFLHMMRVMKLAENMAVIGGDIDVIRAAVALHDLITYSKNSPESKLETEQTATYAQDLLRQIKFPEGKIKKVVRIIVHSSLTKGEYPYSDEGYLVYAADKLDQTGAIGIMRYSASGGQQNRAPYHSEDPVGESRRNAELDESAYSIDAMLVRLPKIAKRLKMALYSETAKQRNKFFSQFLSQLKLELVQEKQHPSLKQYEVIGAERLMNIFSQAGKNGQSFYDTDDPFAQRRKLDGERFALDRVISDFFNIDKMQSMETSPIYKDILSQRKKFIQDYFDELKYELSGELELPPGFPKVDLAEQ